MSVDVQPPASLALSLARCLACSRPLDGREACEGCGRRYPLRDGIVEAMGPLRGSNRVAADFYDGDGWRRFRPWERLFLTFQGGQAGARRQILRFLPRADRALVLEVGIGDGDNLPLLPPGWDVLGVDLARNRLAACRDRFPAMTGRLVRAEAERLPFAEGLFDVVLCVGGFNYFRDPERSLREMRRVGRPGATIVVADEDPRLIRLAPGHLIGLEWIDRLWLRAAGLGREFAALVLASVPDPFGAAARALPGHVRVPIWNRLGYCLVQAGGRMAPGRLATGGDSWRR